MTQPAPAIQIEDLSFAYNGSPVLKNVSLKIGPREMVCVVGPNGGGKTTLLKLILGLLQPTRGRVRVLGLSPAEARHWVGYTPQHQQFDDRFPVSARDIVLMGRLGSTRRIGPYRQSDKRLAERCLAEVGLEGLGRSQFAELSGGQRQRVLIARSLACEPKILLLDEPTANLDASAEAQLLHRLEGLSDRMAILLVSHDIAFVTRQAGRVVCVNQTVSVHPTADLTGQRIVELYGQDVRLVRHDHDCLTQCPPEDEDA